MSDLRAALQAIYDRRGELSPAAVVDEARDPGHELHDRFEWNNAVAGESWRRQQARQLIRSVNVVYREADELHAERSVRAFHAVSTESGHTYKPVDEVVADEFLTRLVMRDMERDWKTLRRRYERFSEFWQMVEGDVGEATG